MIRPYRRLAAVIAISLAACGDAAQQVLGPDSVQYARGQSKGSLEVHTSSTGTGLPAGYTVRVNGGRAQSIESNDVVTYTNLNAGDYVVELSDVASNCTVGGANRRTVAVTAGTTTSTTFEITCSAETGTLEVTTVTMGSDPDPDGYTVRVNGNVEQAIGVNGTITFPGLSAGEHQVELVGMASNCTVGGANPRTVAVTAGTTTSTTFEITCSAETGTLEVTTVTMGSDLDPDGYTVRVNGNVEQAIGVNGTITFPGLSAGEHQVELVGMASNCTVGGANPRTVMVTAGQTASTTFEITCSPLIPDSWIYEAELVRRPTSTSQLDTFEKPNKPMWWHDGHWWVMTDGWRAYRRDATGAWTQASNTLMGQNGRRLDVHVRTNGDIVFYGRHQTDARIGTARYDPATKTYTSTANFSAPAGNHAGYVRWGSLAIDSQGRAWVNYGLHQHGINQYAVYDLSTQTQLLGATTLDNNIWTSEHLSRMVAFEDAEGPKIGVFLDDQVSGEMRFWVRRDVDPLNSGWRKEIVAVDRGGGTELGISDDHGDVIVTPAGEVLAVWKTNYRGISAPNIMYARRTVNGTWVDHTAVRTRYGSSSHNEFTRPRIQYDVNSDHVYVVSYTADAREIHVVRSTRTNPNFGASDAPGPGRPWPAPVAMVNVGGTERLNPAVSAAPITRNSGYFLAFVNGGQIWGLHLPVQ
jgi:hypothetical protein